MAKSRSFVHSQFASVLDSCIPLSVAEQFQAFKNDMALEDTPKRRSDPDVRELARVDRNQSATELASVAPVSLTSVDTLIQETDDALSRRSLPMCASAPAMVSSAPTSPKIPPPKRHSMLANPAAASGFLHAVSHGSFIRAAVARSRVVSFFDVFGYLGIASIVVFVFSALWTLVLAVIQIYPNEMANSIMNTAEFDYGDFWLLPQPGTPIVVSSVVLLVLFAFGYFALAVYMLSGLRHIDQPLKRPHSEPSHETQASDSPDLIKSKDITKFSKGTIWLREQCTNPTPLKRHYFNAALDIPKLIFQTTTLFTYLTRGFPKALIFFYSHLLLFNWLVSCYRYRRIQADPHFIIARLFYGFDLFFAVFAPLTVLVYFIYNFNFDRAAFGPRLEMLPKGTYDNTARLYGSPEQISSFCSAFHYLQITTGSSLFYKSALNLLSLYKWRKITAALIHNARERTTATSLQESSEQKAKKTIVTPHAPKTSDMKRQGSAKAVAVAVKHARAVKRDWAKLLVAASFLIAGGIIFIYAGVAVDSTKKLCDKYKHCVVASYQWNVGAKHCTCLVFVDRQPVVKTYDEWMHPVDTSASLGELAIAGELRIVQIINRAVPKLPESLRRCKHLEQIIIIYTKTTELPDWITEFSELEYFHYEGDFTSVQLTSLPDGMFNNWPHLAFLHLGGIFHVPSIPSLEKLHNLRYLVMAGLISIHEVPDFSKLHKLQRIQVIDAAHAPTLPSVARLNHLQLFVLRYRNAVCCNGFMTGKCDLTDYYCSPHANEPLVTCTDERISVADKNKLASINSTYCPANMTLDTTRLAPTEYTTRTLCGGILYRQCSLNGKPGICFNSRMQVINCVIIPGYIAMRQLQIARGVGDPCDPAVEAWLGCK